MKRGDFYTALISGGALLFLVYSAGVATAYFNAAPARLLREAFPPPAPKNAPKEKKARREREKEKRESRPSGVTVNEAPAPGATLFPLPGKTAASLVAADGKVLHRWERSASDTFPHATCESGDPYWQDAQLLPGGDLLALYACDGLRPGGLGIARLTPDSRVAWATPLPVRNAMDVTEDGKIYALAARRSEHGSPSFPNLSPPYTDDTLVIMDKNGKIKKEISFIEAFASTPYIRNLLKMQSAEYGDYLQANSIQFITPALARASRQFRAGQVLIGMRGMRALAAVDPEKGEITWLKRGPWRLAYSARLRPDGTLRIFDALIKDKRASRILDISPKSMEQAGEYSQPEGEQPFFSRRWGMQQDLPGGGMLITQSEKARLMEVNAEGKTVWEYYYPSRRGDPGLLYAARRYPPSSLSFLKEK